MEVMVAISKAAEARDGGRRTVATRDENGYVRPSMISILPASDVQSWRAIFFN
jgi:hypothetical protein